MLYVKYGKNRLHGFREMLFENVDDRRRMPGELKINTVLRRRGIRLLRRRCVCVRLWDGKEHNFAFLPQIVYLTSVYLTSVNVFTPLPLCNLH